MPSVHPALTIKSSPFKESVAALKQTLHRARNAPLVTPRAACLVDKEFIKFDKLTWPITTESRTIAIKPKMIATPT